MIIISMQYFGGNGASSKKAGAGAGAKTLERRELINQTLKPYEDPRGVIPTSVEIAVEKLTMSGNKKLSDAWELEKEANDLRKSRSVIVAKLGRAEADLGKNDPETKSLRKKANAQLSEIHRLEASAKSLKKEADADYSLARTKLKPYQK